MISHRLIGTRACRAGIATLATAYAVMGSGAAVTMASPSADDTVQEFAIKRSDADDLDQVVFLSDDDDLDGASEDATTTAFGATKTANLDGDGTRGNDRTNGGATLTRNLDGDDTRGNDGTSAGDGGTITRNLDGDDTRGNDGTNGAATVTRNRDGDDTRGNDGTEDGDDTKGEDGTSGGDNTATGDPDTSTDD